MRIDRLDLIRYGKFTDRGVELPLARRDFHVIVGPNEAGKSTLRSAIHHLLYGFPQRNPGYAFLHPLPDLRLAASIRHGEHALAFQRIKASKATLRGTDDAALPDDVLAPFLGSVDARFFEQMFSLDHERLVAGGASILSAADEDAGQVLFESAAVIASLGRIRAELEAEADSLWARRKSSARAYYQAEQTYDEARHDLKAASLRAKDWAEAHAKVEELGAELRTALEQQARLKARRGVLQRVRRVTPLLATLDTESARLAGLAEAAELPETAAARLDEAERRLASVEVDRAHQRRLKETAEQELHDVQLDTALVELEEEIVALDELRLQYRAYPADLEKRELEIRAQWAVVADLAGQIGWDARSEEAVAARLPGPPARAALVRLARQRDTLAQAQQGAERTLRQRQRDIEHARADLERLGLSHVEPSLRAAMTSARALGDTQAVLRDLRAEVAGRQRELDLARQALGGDATQPDALAAMLPPPREHLQALLEEHRHDESEALGLQRELRRIDDQLAAVAAASRRVREQQHPVLLDDLRQARQERHDAWSVIKQDPSSLPAHAQRYELLVAQADSLADQRHDHAHDAAELQGLEDRRGTLELEQQALQRQVDALRAKAARREAAWASLRDECRLPVLSLLAAPEWLQARERALAAWQALDAANHKLVAFQDATAQAADALAAELRAAGLAAGGTELGALLNQAEERVRQQDESRGERKSLEQQLAAASREIETLRDAAASAEQSYQAWLRDWREALLGAGFQSDDDPAKVEAALEVLGRIGEGLASIRQIRDERIDTMRADLRNLDDRAQAQARRIRPGLAGRPAGEVIVQLRRELTEAHATRTRIEQARAQLAAAQEALERGDREEQELRSSVAALVQRAGVADLTQLRPAIGRSDDKRRLQAAVDAASRALLEQGDGLPLETLREEAQGLDPRAVAGELAELEAGEDALLHRIQELSASRNGAEATLRTMAGQADAATAEARRQESMARMADAVERFLKVHTAARLLAWAIERYRDARQGPMLAAASATFARLTLGSFERLMVDFDAQPPSLHGRRPDGTTVGVEGMSEGTRDQLYLALRLAALDMHLARAHAMPFVADDLFINFDDRRTRAGLEALAMLSERTQVLFLTHHEHVLPLVQDVFGGAVNTVRL